MSSKVRSNIRLSSILTVTVFFLSACSTLPRITAGRNAPAGESRDSSLVNGEKIYFTATNAKGARIPYTQGPRFGGMMMGSYLTCAACHGPEARGGEHIMHMQVMDAPDIRYTALSGEADGHAEEEEGHEHADGHGDYDLADFSLAVVEGKHPDGQPLSRDMPRWQMNDRDLADLFAFLKSLPE